MTCKIINNTYICSKTIEHFGLWDDLKSASGEIAPDNIPVDPISGCPLKTTGGNIVTALVNKKGEHRCFFCKDGRDRINKTTGIMSNPTCKKGKSGSYNATEIPAYSMNSPQIVKFRDKTQAEINSGTLQSIAGCPVRKLSEHNSYINLVNAPRLQCGLCNLDRRDTFNGIVQCNHGKVKLYGVTYKPYNMPTNEINAEGCSNKVSSKKIGEYCYSCFPNDKLDQVKGGVSCIKGGNKKNGLYYAFRYDPQN